MNTLMKRTNGNGNMPATTFNGLVDKIFQNNVNRLFDDDFWGFTNVSQNVSVPVNVKETDKSYELELVAPGIKKEDFKINVHGDTLTVSFEHQEEQNQQNKEEGWLRKEYQKRSFTRTFHLDEAIDANKIIANYGDGILHLSLPKKEGAQTFSRTIEIK
jgi:HSP20 family protein